MDTLAIPGRIEEAFNFDQGEPNAADQREVNSVDPSPAPSTPSISRGAESSGTTLSAFSQPLSVTVSSSSTDNPPVLDRVRDPAKLSTHPLGPGAAFATPYLILHGVEEATYAYLPLKYIAKRLCVILNNCEVRPHPTTHSIHDAHIYTSERR